MRWLAAVAALVLAGGGVLLGALVGSATPPRSPQANGPVTVVVQNKVAIGPSELVEDTTPVYLSSKPLPYCSHQGCEVAGTKMWSGAVLQAICQQPGTVMTNEDAASPGIGRNPHAATSARWYLAEMPNGTRGYISEVYLTPASRGGLGLPRCPP
jgi:hypothetical protein